MEIDLNSYVNDKLSYDEVFELWELFKKKDEDHSNSICIKEFLEMMKDFGFNPQNNHFFQLFQKVDDDKSGKIDFTEFLELMTIGI